MNARLHCRVLDGEPNADEVPCRRTLGGARIRGRGHHKHAGAREYEYPFTDVDTLVRDFLRDVEKLA